jgi:RAB protein geranylgeranyltransferase component A
MSTFACSFLDRQERVYTEVEGGLASFNVLQEGAQGAAAALLKNGKISTPNKDSQEIFDDKRGLRHYNLDLMPKLIWSVSPTIDTFIQAGVSRYLEFKALEHTFAFGEGTFHQVHSGNAMVFFFICLYASI